MERKRMVNVILVGSLVLCMASSAQGWGLTASATSISALEEQIRNHQNQLNEISGRIDTLTDARELAQEAIDDLNSEIINTMTSIGIKEDEIAEKERELAGKQKEIDITQQKYEAAKALEEQQHADMAARARILYKQGDTSYVSLLLAGSSFGEALNRMDFTEKIYEYDKNKLGEYESTKKQAQELGEFLASEKAQLEADRAQLTKDREVLEDLKARLDKDLEKKKKESANYEAELKKAQQAAAVAKTLLQQEQRQLKQMQQMQAAQLKPNNAATSGNYTTTNYTSVINNASGSETGKNIAKYACQFIGNPYVYGGTSLTNGADCSGFTLRVYSDFGYRLPRTSYEQRSVGTGVSYDEAQPGDLICYEGHVALYIGGGLIVHASTRETGIKVSRANYTTILTVRRVLQ